MAQRCLVVMAADGAVNLVLSRGSADHPFTFWQQMWRYSFIDAYFYAGIITVEHAGRYYRLWCS